MTDTSEAVDERDLRQQLDAAKRPADRAVVHAELARDGAAREPLADEIADGGDIDVVVPRAPEVAALCLRPPSTTCVARTSASRGRMVGDMPGDFTYRGFMVGLVAELAHPSGWFGVATIAGGDLAEDAEHVIRTPEPFAEEHDALPAAGELARAWIDQRK